MVEVQQSVPRSTSLRLAIAAAALVCAFNGIAVSASSYSVVPTTQAGGDHSPPGPPGKCGHCWNPG